MQHFDGKPHLAFRRQLIQLGGIVLVVLLLILFLSLDATLRGQLPGLLGIIISATIALSSTTLVQKIARHTARIDRREAMISKD